MHTILTLLFLMIIHPIQAEEARALPHSFFLLKTEGADPIELVLTSEISPPEIDGRKLCATSLSLSGNIAIVAYNQVGERIEGGVDLVDISDPNHLQLKERLLFTDAKVNHGVIHRHHLYLALGKQDESGRQRALLRIIPINAGILDVSNKNDVPLVGTIATSLSLLEQGIFVTTAGGKGGLLEFNDAGSLIYVLLLRNLRWHARVDQHIYALLQAEPGQLSLIDTSRYPYEVIQTLPISGLLTKEERSSFEVIGYKAFIASDLEGVKVIDLRSGLLLATLPINYVPWAEVQDQRTLSVTAEQNFVCMANGGAGITVVLANENLYQTYYSKSLSFETVGTIHLGQGFCATHAQFYKDYLLVSSGTGGLQAICIKNLFSYYEKFR